MIITGNARARSAHRPTVVHETMLGPVTLSASPTGLTRMRFGRSGNTGRCPTPVDGSAEQPLLEQAVAEIDDYLKGRRTGFEVPIDLSGVEPARRRVLEVLSRVGFGSTCSYTELARAAGLTEDGPRRVGAACAANPVLLFVPCHRVVAANGALTGYSGGVPIKKALLALEAGQYALMAYPTTVR